MTLLEYPKGTFRGDCLRGVAGLAMILVLLSLAVPSIVASSLLLGIAVVFSIHIFTAWRRAQYRYTLSDEALIRYPDGLQIQWSGLCDLKLAYFTTRRDYREGWFELKLVAGQQVITVDSRLDGFNSLLQRATRAAQYNHLQLCPSTCMNLSEMFGDSYQIVSSMDSRMIDA